MSHNATKERFDAWWAGRFVQPSPELAFYKDIAYQAWRAATGEPSSMEVANAIAYLQSAEGSEEIGSFTKARLSEIADLVRQLDQRAPQSATTPPWENCTRCGAAILSQHPEAEVTKSASGYKLPGNVLAFLMTCAGPAFSREDVRLEASLMLKGHSTDSYISNAAPQATDAPSALGEESPSVSRPAVAAPPSTRSAK